MKNNRQKKDIAKESLFYISLTNRWDIIYLVIGIFISLCYFLGYYYYDLLHILSKYSILLFYLLICILLIRGNYGFSVFWVLVLGYIFRVVVIDFTLTTSLFVDFKVFAAVQDFLGYYSLKSFTYLPYDLWYLFPILSFLLDTFIFVFVYYILRYYGKSIYFLVLFWWNPFWISSIYSHWNPFLIYVFFLFLSFFLLLYKQRFMASIALVFVFGFYDFFYVFLLLSIYELKVAFLLLLIAGFSFLNIYLEFMVRRFIYSDFIQDIIDYLGSGMLFSVENIFFLFLVSFIVVSWFWSIFLKRSFLTKVYIAVFVLLLCYPPFFLRGLSLLTIVLGVLFSNWGFLALSLYFFIEPLLGFEHSLYIEYVIIWLGFFWFVFVYFRSKDLWEKLLIGRSRLFL